VSVPMHIAYGPHGLHNIDFRVHLRERYFKDMVADIKEAANQVNGRWIDIRPNTVHAGPSLADAYCRAETEEELQRAAQWLLDMAAVLRGGAT